MHISAASILAEVTCTVGDKYSGLNLCLLIVGKSVLFIVRAALKVAGSCTASGVHSSWDVARSPSAVVMDAER